MLFKFNKKETKKKEKPHNHERNYARNRYSAPNGDLYCLAEGIEILPSMAVTQIDFANTTQINSADL